MDEHEKNLTEHIRSYLTTNSPSPGMHNNSVYCLADLYQILSVEEKSNVFNAKIWLYCYYLILEMEWDPEDFGGIRSLNFKKDTFWTPDIELNSITSNEYQSPTFQFIHYEGGLVLPITTSINAKLSCKFDISDFPHDQHTCILQLAFPIEYANGKQQMLLENYVSHDQWELLPPVLMEAGFVKFAGGLYDQQSYNIRIRRSPDFFLRVLVYPTLLIYAISSLSFYLPFESGEKISLSITILLAQVVNLLVLSDSIPASSINFPVFVLVSVITLNMYPKSTPSAPPRFLRKLLYTRIAWVFGAAKIPSTCNTVTNVKKVVPDTQCEKSPPPSNDSLFNKVKEIEDMMPSAEVDDQILKEWQLIALLIDRCSGIIYIIAGIVVFFMYNPLQF